MKLTQIAFAALLGATLAAPVFAQPAQGMGPGGGMGQGMGPGGGGMGPGGGQGKGYQFNKDNTFGWNLMTPEERSAHHNAMMSAKTYEECKAAQEAQHKQMEARAKEQGQDTAGRRARTPLRPCMKARRLLQVIFSSIRHGGPLRRGRFFRRAVAADFRAAQAARVRSARVVAAPLL